MLGRAVKKGLYVGSGKGGPKCHRPGGKKRSLV